MPSPAMLFLYQYDVAVVIGNDIVRAIDIPPGVDAAGAVNQVGAVENGLPSPAVNEVNTFKRANGAMPCVLALSFTAVSLRLGSNKPFINANNPHLSIGCQR